MSVESLESRVESQKRWIALRSYSGPRPSTLDPRPCRRGLTLIELLVVIIILTTIVAAAIPIMAPSNDDRRIREAARTLNTFITGAQARAIQNNRLYGIALKRLSQDTNKDPNKNTDPTKDIHDDNAVCLEVFYVEQPAPYSGADTNSRACVSIDPNPPSSVPNAVLVQYLTHSGATGANLPPGWEADPFPSGMIRPGDVIVVGGTRYELLLPQSNLIIRADTGYFEQQRAGIVASVLARPINNTGQMIQPKYDNLGREIGSVVDAKSPYWTSPMPYKILRQAAPSSDPAFQLPEGTAIDLRASGVGAENYFYVPESSKTVTPRIHDNSQGILIMFAPEGRVARVSFSQLPNDIDKEENAAFDDWVVDNVYLLVGRRDKAPPLEASGDPTLNSVPASGTPNYDENIKKLKEPINWLSGTSRWIVIGSQSGRIATIENASVDLNAVLNYPLRPFDQPQSPEEWRCAQILSAREFTREMGQQGGR
jgi:prepilin-type N-terminal cleavage/methylation domain-containing protein